MSPELSETATPPEPSKDKQPTSLESAATVARRLDRSVRTVDRYVEVGILPEPLRIRGRRFWPAGVMPKIDLPNTKRRPPARGTALACE